MSRWRKLPLDLAKAGEMLREYLATGVWWEGSVATIRCTPTLRQAYAAEPLRLRPTMIAGLLSDDGAELKLARARYGSPTLVLEERFDEPLS